MQYSYTIQNTSHADCCAETLVCSCWQLEAQAVSCSLSGGTGLPVENKMILHTVRTMYAEMAILFVTAGTLQQAYLEKIPLSALVAFAIAGGWDQTSFMRRHFCGRALVSC